MMRRENAVAIVAAGAGRAGQATAGGVTENQTAIDLARHGAAWCGWNRTP